MADNRLYIVDTKSNEYLCISKKYGYEGWDVGNIEIYQDFMSTRTCDGDGKTNLLLGTEGDDAFYKKWIVGGKDFFSNSEKKQIEKMKDDLENETKK